ncbi:MAG TPA: NYN domain-containing protein [Saprospiraceae bacterium]|nr:NYN domain-containing protein [Saprospiraceae bacterium]
MKRFAFIDVQNTETTTLKVLKFATDHERLFAYLKERWNCDKVFFYPGIEHGDEERTEVFDKITEIGGIVRPKFYYVYRISDKVVSTNCPKCNTEITQRINMGHTWKCNCDIEMTIDILDHAQGETELLIFTGDGDFESLIERAVLNGSKVYLLSSARKVKSGHRYATSRFATKLRALITKYSEKVIYLEINDWKLRIKMEQLN